MDRETPPSPSIHKRPTCFDQRNGYVLSHSTSQYHHLIVLCRARNHFSSSLWPLSGLSGCSSLPPWCSSSCCRNQTIRRVRKFEHAGSTLCNRWPCLGFSAGPLNQFGATQFVKVRPIFYFVQRPRADLSHVSVIRTGHRGDPSPVLNTKRQSATEISRGKLDVLPRNS